MMKRTRTLKSSSNPCKLDKVKRSIKWSTMAATDRNSLYKWIYERNQTAAKRIEGEIRAAINLLKDLPKMGAEYDIKGVRKHPVSNTEFTVFYAIVDADIVVLRVLHQSQNIPLVNFTDENGSWLM